MLRIVDACVRLCERSRSLAASLVLLLLLFLVLLLLVVVVDVVGAAAVVVAVVADAVVRSLVLEQTLCHAMRR